MSLLCYRCHRFPAEIIQHAIRLYLRFTLSYRDVEELLAERGLDISYETVRRWVLKFGPAIARRLRRRRPRPSKPWHLDEMVVRIAGKRMYLWRAVDHEGGVLDMLLQRRRDSRAALRLMRKLLKKQGFAPKLLVTDKLERQHEREPIPARTLVRSREALRDQGRVAECQFWVSREMVESALLRPKQAGLKSRPARSRNRDRSRCDFEI